MKRRCHVPLATLALDRLWGSIFSHHGGRMFWRIPSRIPYKVDIAIANILSGPLVTLAGTLAGAVQPGGALVLSGILDDQADEVRQAYEPWFGKQELTAHAGWARLNFIRNDRVHTVS